jgi:hypothetical protein
MVTIVTQLLTQRFYIQGDSGGNQFESLITFCTEFFREFSQPLQDSGEIKPSKKLRQPSPKY